MVGIETILLESGAVLVAGLIIGLYNELSSRSVARPITTSVADEQTIESEIASKPPDGNQNSSQPPITNGILPHSHPPISEAPAPFPEESFSMRGISIPTDVAAASKLMRPSASISPVFVIPVPKRKRARRPLSTKKTEVRYKATKIGNNMREAEATTEKANLSTQQRE